MSEHFISRRDAESDLLAAATYIAERITSVDGHAEAITFVVPQYLKKGNVDLAAELSNTVDDPFTRDRLLTLVAEKCAELDDEQYALQLADAVQEEGMRAQAMERVALRLAAKGDFEQAHAIAVQMDHPDGVLVGIAVNQSAKGLDTASVETISKISYPHAAVTAFHDIAVTKLHADDKEGAIEWLEKAAERAGEIEHLEERSRAYCDIGNAFTEAGRNDRAIETFDKAKSTAETIDNMHRDAFLSLTAQGFLRAGSVDLADRTLDLIADKTHIAGCLLGYSREFWRKDERDEGLESLEEAYAILESQHERETRDSRARFRLLTQIAAQFAGFEKGERAIEIAERIKDESERTSALSQIAAILTIREEDEQARHAFRAITDDGDRAFALIGMSDAKEKNGESDAAIQLLNEAAALAETVPQLTFRSSAYNEIGRRLMSYGEAMEANKAFQNSLNAISEVRDSSAQAVSLAALGQIADETGFDPDESFRAILQALTARASL